MSTKLKTEDIEKRLETTFEETVLFRALRRIPKLSSDGPWIAGGAVRRTILGEELESDFDFFFKSEGQMKKFQEDLSGMGASLVSENDKNKKYMLPGKVPDDAEGSGVYLPEMEIQLINFRYYQNAEEVLDSFDFTLCQFVYDGESVYAGDFSLFDVARKRLVPHKITFATSSVRRCIKYANQGYSVCGGALSEILNQVVANQEIIQEEVRYID